MHNSNNKHKHEVINSNHSTFTNITQGMKQENIIC